MNTHTRTSTRFAFLALLALGPAASWAPAPAGAQQIPWIGLAAPGARLVLEEGTGHHGPGGADFFGFAVAAGDFTGDGIDDLAVGVPGNDCDFVVWDCGSVQIRRGLGGGLGLTGPMILDPILHPQRPAEAFDEYGHALAVGDFDNDGFDDLAVGIPGKDHPLAGGFAIEGAVEIHYGVQDGIQLVAEHFLQQSVDGVPFEPWSGTAPHTEDRFGHALAVGDFNGDGHDDLAMGAPYALSPSRASSGNVIVAHGHSEGLMPFAGFLMRLGREGLPGVPLLANQFGYALAAGDFNGDGFDDLAIGAPHVGVVGKVLVVYGSPVSLIFPDHRYFGSGDLGGEAQSGMRFGAALAVGDFDRDGRDDLAIGAPLWNGLQVDMGVVAVVYGPPLDPPRVHWFHEDLLYGTGNGEPLDDFGWALAAGDFNGDGIDDLAIGTPGENLESSAHPNTGAVSVIPGRQVAGLTGAPRQLRPVSHQPGAVIDDPAGLIPDYRAGEPLYGSALAAGDFDGNGFDDLAIGAPSRTWLNPPLVDAGAVAVLYGRLFADGFETGNVAAWSSAAP